MSINQINLYSDLILIIPSIDNIEEVAAAINQSIMNEDIV
jgi:hypothetical protein